MKGKKPHKCEFTELDYLWSCKCGKAAPDPYMEHYGGPQEGHEG